MPDQANPPTPHQTTNSAALCDNPLATDHSTGMQRVKTGLTVVYYGVFGALLLEFIAPLVSGEDREFVGSGFAAFAAMATVGLLMCLSAPSESDSKKLIYASVALVFICWVGSLASYFANAPTLGRCAATVGILALVCVMLFTRKISLHINRPDVGARAAAAAIVGFSSAIGAVAGYSRDISDAYGVLGTIVALFLANHTVKSLREAIVL